MVRNLPRSARSEDGLGVYLLLIGLVREVFPLQVPRDGAVTHNRSLLFLQNSKRKLMPLKHNTFFFNVET